MHVPGKVTVILGTQFGDEGKGKVVDIMSEHYDFVCRAQGGSNAGHTVVVNNQKFAFHLLPRYVIFLTFCGILHNNTTVVIGNGVVVHIPSLFQEIHNLESQGVTDARKRLIISDRAHIVCDFHQQVDKLSDEIKGKNCIGTTGKGIGPTYSSKVTRNGVRMCDLIYNFQIFKERVMHMFSLFKAQYPKLTHDVEAEIKNFHALKEVLAPMVKDTLQIINTAIKNQKSILVEGANAHLLDIDFGTYPFVTSSNCGVAGVCTGLGIPPSRIGPIIGIMKAYSTRVGQGPFPTELLNNIGDNICERGHEYGTTTGRRRRCGWLDLVMVRSCDLVTDMTCISLTKLDVLDGICELKVAVSYELPDGTILTSYPANLELLCDVKVNYVTLKGWSEAVSCAQSRNDLPLEAQEYVKFIESELNKKVINIGVGCDRKNIIN